MFRVHTNFHVHKMKTQVFWDVRPYRLVESVALKLKALDRSKRR
jgi:hypothetical protein